MAGKLGMRGAMPARGTNNISKKGEHGIYDRMPNTPDPGHSMGKDTVPIKVMESIVMPGQNAVRNATDAVNQQPQLVNQRIATTTNKMRSDRKD